MNTYDDYLKIVKNFLTITYYSGYVLKKAAVKIVKQNLENYAFSNENLFKRYPDFNIGETIVTDKYGVVPVYEYLSGNNFRWVPPKTVGWILEKCSDNKSKISYRVLFPQGVYWVEQYWLHPLEYC